MTAEVSRFAMRFLRTGRYLADLLVWSKIFTARRTHENFAISAELRAKKGVHFAQPQLDITGRTGAEHFAHGFNITYDILFANLRMANHFVHSRYALPGPGFAGVYLWDSAFIAQIWRHWDRDVAAEVLESVLVLRDGDRLQHVVADFVSSKFTQPPLIAWSFCKIADEDPALYKKLTGYYSVFVAYHNWLRKNRRLSSGLYFWQHPYESGVENAPRFSSRDEKKLDDTRHIAAPDFSAYMVMQCESLISLASYLGLNDDVVLFERERDELIDKINRVLWCEDDGLYYDFDERNQQLIRSRTIASMLPLAAGVPSQDQAKRLSEHACAANRFGSTIPMPSVALDDPCFEKDMWRGPVWINTAYLVLDGLKRYGYHAAYSELAWRLCDGVYRVLETEHQIYEFYDPENFHTRELQRKKGNLWKAITLGTGPQKDFVGWSGLVNTLLIEGLLGLNKRGCTWQICVNLPPEADGLHFDLFLPQDNCRIKVTRMNDHQVNGELHVDGMQHRFSVMPGQQYTVYSEQTQEAG